MKAKVFNLAALSIIMALSVASCSKDDDPKPKFKVLTFEDVDYKGGSSNYWSSLIDKEQYGGVLLYGDMQTNSYSWADKGNTELKHSSGMYWTFGEAISNYVDTDLTHGDYFHQLSVPIKDSKTGFGGHNGSKNFCVHNGYIDDFNSSLGFNTLSAIEFGDGQPHIVNHLYIAPTTYLLNVMLNGDTMTGAKPLTGSGDWFKIIAIGCDSKDNELYRSEFYLAKDGKIVKEWTKWDLSSLGVVNKICFNFDGSDKGQYGIKAPAYFAYDDVAIQ